MSFTKANKSVLESLFGAGVNWQQQATGLTASNGAPSLLADGINLNGKAAFAVQAVVTATPAAFNINVWGYANGKWTVIPSGSFEGLGDGGMLEVGISGVADYIYVEAEITTGTLDLNIGVPNS